MLLRVTNKIITIYCFFQDTMVIITQRDFYVLEFLDCHWPR